MARSSAPSGWPRSRRLCSATGSTLRRESSSTSPVRTSRETSSPPRHDLQRMQWSRWRRHTWRTFPRKRLASQRTASSWCCTAAARNWLLPTRPTTMAPARIWRAASAGRGGSVRSPLAGWHATARPRLPSTDRMAQRCTWVAVLDAFAAGCAERCSHRDEGLCRAPACTDAATQIHHVRHWAHGGPTCLSNLISLCDRHHWLVHEGGYRLVAAEPGHWVLISPEGARLGPHPEPHSATQGVSVGPDVTADAVTGHWDGSQLDPTPIIWAVLPDSDNVSVETSEPDSGGCEAAPDYGTVRLNAFTT